ncbi:DUF5719 family protein [Galbitalea sp. SE-J8]|uniref:DUF5719 family protein n=1 Tax=Galbitalea sp. SE-J8 TaxID=3054952 RepID=UPI00259CC121|nr:DUF5719 family protein [Galbitalea sp. SE-J8]MDM4762715.1 DUF5719 family protein [Galbitalea sp. SE-J8]
MSEQGEPRRPASARPSARTVALASARVALAVVALGVAIVTVGAAAMLPLPTIAPTPGSTLVVPVATPQSLVCPGAVLRLGDASGQDVSTASPIGQASVAAGGDPDRSALDGPGGAIGLTGAGETDSTVSGAQLQELSDPAASGLAATACAPVASESWLIGGSNAVGRTTVLTLDNPSDVAATVDLSIWDESGAVTARGATGISVGAHAQSVIALAGLAPDAVSPVVRVESTGGLITATLQETVVRGLETAGADLVGASAAPSGSLVFPGLTVRGSDDVESRIFADTTGASDDLAPVLRLFAPGGAATDATIEVRPLDGSPGTTSTVSVPAGQVLDAPIEGLVDGEYTIAVSSAEPLVGAVRMSTAVGTDRTSGTSDLAWSVAPPRLGSAAVAEVVDGAPARLHLVNPGGSPIDATVTDPTGAAKDVPLEPGATWSTDAAAGSWGVSATGAVAASVTYAADGELATYPVLPRVADADPVRVYP